MEHAAELLVPLSVDMHTGKNWYEQENKMKVIGITGGVGSGKSEVLKFLEQEYGAVVCQMDEVAKQIQKKGTRAFTRIVQEFGEQIVGNNGELDRMKLGSCVFADEKKLQRLNEIVHPEVLEWVQKDILKKKRRVLFLLYCRSSTSSGSRKGTV